MKKLTALFLAMTMMLSLAACGSSPSANPGSSSSGTSEVSASSATAPDFDTEWPKKTIQLVVPYAAGGDTDYYARTTARYLEDILGVTIAVVNTAGASGTTGALSVLDQDSDGYCFLFGHESVMFNQAAGSVPFDYLTDFVAVGSTLIDPSYTLCCRADAPYSTLEELAAYCKEHPGEVTTIASSGGSSGYSAEKMEEALGGISFRFVEGPSSSSEKLAGFLGGQYDLLTGNFAQYKDYVAEGSVVCLGNYGSMDVPALEELGITSWRTQGFDYVNEHMFMIRAKAGTDQAIVDKLAWAMQQIVEDPGYVDEIALYNGVVGWNDGDACVAFEQAYYDGAVEYLAANK